MHGCMCFSILKHYYLKVDECVCVVGWGGAALVVGAFIYRRNSTFLFGVGAQDFLLVAHSEAYRSAHHDNQGS